MRAASDRRAGAEVEAVAVRADDDLLARLERPLGAHRARGGEHREQQRGEQGGEEQDSPVRESPPRGRSPRALWCGVGSYSGGSQHSNMLERVCVIGESITPVGARRAD